MPRILYTKKNFRADALQLIDVANAIAQEYAAAGYNLTLRQLYYQFVARGIIANKQTEYKRLGGIINDARLAGLIDWDHLTDRTRGTASLSTWASPSAVMESAIRSYHTDWWKDQDVHVEVWVEKEALADVVEQACDRWSVTSLACRGYVSQSTQWESAQRLYRKVVDGKRVVVLHLGDHDPSGIDMSRDNEERIRLFLFNDIYRRNRSLFSSMVGSTFSAIEQFSIGLFNLPPEFPLFTFERIALNMDQIQQYDPPPNPAKTTDARYASYRDEFGEESWELDALPPDVLTELIDMAIGGVVDIDLFEAAQEREERQRNHMRSLLDQHKHELDEQS